MRYYFDIRTANMTMPDTEGAELSGIEEALDEALISAREVIAYAASRGQSVTSWRFVIRDEKGSGVIFPFRTALHPTTCQSA